MLFLIYLIHITHPCLGTPEFHSTLSGRYFWIEQCVKYVILIGVEFGTKPIHDEACHERMCQANQLKSFACIMQIHVGCVFDMSHRS